MDFGPEHREQLLLAYDPLAVVDEVAEKLDHFGLELDGLPLAPQLVAARIELEFTEGVGHDGQCTPPHS